MFTLAALFFGGLFALMWLFCVRNANSFARPKPVEVEEDFVPREILVKRSKNARLIDDWVMSTRRSKRTSVWDWRFVSKDATDRIMFLHDEKGWVEGTVRFKYDRDFPRVSSVSYMEGDIEKKLNGTPLPIMPMEMMVKAFIAELNNDARKIKYVNTVAQLALENGKAEFSICRYEQISKRQFEQIYGLREIKALCKAISTSSGVNLTYDRTSRKCIMTMNSDPQ